MGAVRGGCVLFVTVMLQVCWFPMEAAAASPVTLEAVATRIAGDLDAKSALRGRTVQVSQNNFYERETGVNLPFSAVVRDALARALSDRGAVVTVQEVGAEPVKMVGTYGRQGSDMVITTRLRVMGETASADIAVSQARLAMDRLDPRWFKLDFTRMGRTLVRILEQNYTGLNDLQVDILPLEPGLFGQPSLLLGKEFKAYLQSAVMDSSVFGGTGTGGNAIRATMAGNYAQISGFMRFDVKVKLSDQRVVASAQFKVPLSDIPPSLLAVVSDRQVTICTVYRRVSSFDLPEDAAPAMSLLDLVNEALAAHNLKADRCLPGAACDVQVETHLKIKRRKSAAGYGVALGSIEIKASAKDGRVIGNLVYPVKALYTDDADAALDTAVQRTLKARKAGDQLAAMILGR
jgi:hypothetical protein